MSHTVIPPRIYVAVFAVLLVLTAVTTAVAYVDLGVMNVVAMLAIAVAKALLVILFFMHVRYGSRLTWLYVSAGFVWFGILVLFTVSDVLTRTEAPLR
jgi:cytochrome c oxidase subunit 4